MTWDWDPTKDYTEACSDCGHVRRAHHTWQGVEVSCALCRCTMFLSKEG